MACPVWDPNGSRPTPTAPDPMPESILVVGDSLAYSIALLGLDFILGFYADPIPVVHNYAIGSSTIEPGAAKLDWVDHLDNLLDELAPDVVVAHFLGQVGTTTETVVRGRAFIDTCRAEGVPIAWCIPPKVNPALSYAATCEAAAAAYQSSAFATATWRPNLRDVLTPGGIYTTCLKSQGVDETIRHADGVHLAGSGDIMAADAIVSAMH